MNFTITTNPNLTSGIPSFNKFGKYYYYFDSRTEISHKNNSLYFWFGVSWPVPLSEANFDNISEQNGSWFYGRIYENCIEIYTDIHSDYPIFYSKRNNEITITTDLISFSSKYFSLNKTWLVNAFNRQIYDSEYLSPVEYNPVNPFLIFESNKTILKNVFRLPAAGKLVATPSRLNVKRYYDRVCDYHYKKTLPKISNIDEYVHKKIDNNISSIINQNPNSKVGVQASTGIDSLTVVEALLKKGINFDVATYCFHTDKTLQKWAKNAENLHEYLNKKNINTYFEKFFIEDFFSHFLPEIWSYPTKNVDLFHDIFVAKKYLKHCDYFIKGTNGDECFLHTQRHATVILSKLKMAKTLEDANKIISKSYSYQGNYAFTDLIDYDNLLTGKYKNPTIDLWSLKPSTYLSSDQSNLKKPVYSPYCDRDLITITARMTNDDLYNSSLEAQQQKNYLNETASFLNRYKSGEEEIFDYFFPINQSSIDIIQWAWGYLKTTGIHRHTKNIFSKYLNCKNNDTVSYDSIHLLQLCAWIKNWHELG